MALEKQIPKNDAPSNWNIESLKEYLSIQIEHLSTLISSNDKRYTERFDASEKAVAAALAAQKELTNSAFSSSEKAITKAEDSQRTYNAGHNDLSRKMEDQYKLMVPLTEHKGDKIALEDKIEAVNANSEKRMDRIEADIRSLRESRSSTEGTGKGMDNVWGYIVAGIGVLVGIIGLVTFLMNYVKKS